MNYHAKIQRGTLILVTRDSVLKTGKARNKLLQLLFHMHEVIVVRTRFASQPDSTRPKEEYRKLLPPPKKETETVHDYLEVGVRAT
eukprot:6179742-Pleurochrysis_carterae.AAC.4